MGDSLAGPATIAVLGAGIAGLVAAWELERLGHDVVVLEADSRIGGRVFTHRFGGPDGPSVELGAMRIPGNHRHTLRYVTKLGLERQLRPFGNILSDPANRLRAGNEFVRVDDAARVLIRDTAQYAVGAPPRPETLLFAGWLHALVRALGPRELRELVRTDIEKLLVQADQLDLTPFLHKHGIDLGGALAEHPSLRSTLNGRLESFLDDIVRESGADMLCLAGGMDQLTEGIATRLRRKVHTGHEITGIGIGQDGVRVDIAHRTGRHQARFPIVLCTIPFSVLRSVPLSGADDDKLDVIRTLDYGSATKVGLHCRTAFWTAAGIAGGGSAPGGRIRQTYYPHQDNDPASGAALLASYTIAEDADVLGPLDPADRHRSVVAELARMHPELAAPGELIDAASVAWGQRRWHKGCAARRWGLSETQLDREVERATRPQGRLFFAGEHCSRTPAWIDAGIESALEAVDRIDRCARQTGHDEMEESA